MRSMVGSDPSYAAKKNKCGVDGKAPTCDEEAGITRRLGAEKIVRHWLIRRKEVSRM